MTSPKRAELQYFMPVRKITREEFMEMYPPKRAEPANQHAEILHKVARDLDGKNLGIFVGDGTTRANACRAAAAEIERLAARVRELERPWLPIASAPLDGTRVELWYPDDPRFDKPAHATYGDFYAGLWFDETEKEHSVEPTHYRREPGGPGSPPLPSG